MLNIIFVLATIVASAPSTKTFVVNDEKVRMDTVDKEGLSVAHILTSYDVIETSEEVGKFVRYVLPRGDLDLKVSHFEWDEFGQLLFSAILDEEEVGGKMVLAGNIFVVEISDPNGKNVETYDYQVWEPVGGEDLRPLYIEFLPAPPIIPRCKCGISGEDNNNGVCTTEQCDDMKTCTATNGHTGSCGYRSLVL